MNRGATVLGVLIFMVLTAAFFAAALYCKSRPTAQPIFIGEAFLMFVIGVWTIGRNSR